MSEPIQLTPMLAVYEDEGEFTVRVSDSPLAKSVSPQVIKAIGETVKARKLTLITPTDTKVFKFHAKPEGSQKDEKSSSSQPEGGAPSASGDEKKLTPIRQIQDPAAPPSPEASDEYVRAAQEAESAAQLQAQIDRENGTTLDIPEEIEEKPRTRKRTPRPQAIPTACGRCQGSGAIAGGGPCPVCRGAGSVAHYGSRR